MSHKDEIISAFAFSTGKKIEELIIEQTNNLQETNKHLEAKILQWWTDNGRDEKFAEYFEITSARSGLIS